LLCVLDVTSLHLQLGQHTQSFLELSLQVTRLSVVGLDDTMSMVCFIFQLINMRFKTARLVNSTFDATFKLLGTPSLEGQTVQSQDTVRTKSR
jgi:hypothetical protein